MGTVTKPVAAIAASRGLLWLSEIARDLDVDLVEVGWSDGQWRLRAATARERDLLADRLDLWGASIERGSRWGTWADMHVQVKGPVR